MAVTTNDTINLFDVGCLINLKITTWSARKMVNRNDLIAVGYDPDKLPIEIVNLGRKLLVPRSEIQALTQVEQRARKSVERFSVPFGIASAHFIPIKLLPTTEQQLKELKKEFFTRIDSFITRFDDLVNTVKQSHPEFWEKCLKGNYPANPKELRNHFQFDWFIFKIAGLGSIEKTNVNEIIANQKVQDERTQELRTQMQSEVSEFVGEYITSMRNETVRFCDLIAARINGRPYGDESDIKKLTPKSLSCFRRYIDRFRSMNIFNDNEVEKMLSEFRNNFLDSETTPKDFESATVKDSITKALENIRKKAAAEGESGSKFIGELRRRVVI